MKPNATAGRRPRPDRPRDIVTSTCGQAHGDPAAFVWRDGSAKPTSENLTYRLVCDHVAYTFTHLFTDRHTAVAQGRRFERATGAKWRVVSCG